MVPVRNATITYHSFESFSKKTRRLSFEKKTDIFHLAGSVTVNRVWILRKSIYVAFFGIFGLSKLHNRIYQENPFELIVVLR